MGMRVCFLFLSELCLLSMLSMLFVLLNIYYGSLLSPPVLPFGLSHAACYYLQKTDTCCTARNEIAQHERPAKLARESGFPRIRGRRALGNCTAWLPLSTDGSFIISGRKRRSRSATKRTAKPKTVHGGAGPSRISLLTLFTLLFFFFPPSFFLSSSNITTNPTLLLSLCFPSFPLFID